MSEKSFGEKSGGESNALPAMSGDYNEPLSGELLDILINLTLADYYERVYHYNTSLIGGMIVQLN